MKKYKIRVFGMGIDAVAIIPFDNEPDIAQVQNKIAYYLNNNLMKVEKSSFFSEDKYTITYEEVSI